MERSGWIQEIVRFSTRYSVGYILGIQEKEKNG